jgi:hypothetical protein
MASWLHGFMASCVGHIITAVISGLFVAPFVTAGTWIVLARSGKATPGPPTGVRNRVKLIAILFVFMASLVGIVLSIRTILERAKP